jgi:hypothetical protein
MTTYQPGTANPLQALVLVRLSGRDPARFERFVRAEVAVTAAWHVVGDIDLVVHVSCLDLSDLHRVVTAMRTEGGAVGSVTHLVVNTVDLSRPVNGSREMPARLYTKDLAIAGRQGR